MQWTDHSLRDSLLQRESRRLASLLPTEYYAAALQIGMPEANFLSRNECGVRYQTLLKGDNKKCQSSEYLSFYADCTALPFAKQTLDLIVLPHTLDFCSDPHAIIREVSQILVPQGLLVITGFNKFSLWGLTRVFKLRRERAPWNGNFYRLHRVKDWLALLGYDLIGGSMMIYQPPVGNEKLHKNLIFLDQAGDRWWPGFGAVYMLIARKCELASGLSAGRAKRWHTLIPGLVQPNA